MANCTWLLDRGASCRVLPERRLDRWAARLPNLSMRSANQSRHATRPLWREATVTSVINGERVMEMIGPHTNGVYIISVTPFSEPGDIDSESVDSLVEFYIDKGVSGITILGMMGEAQKLSEAESAAFAKYFIERVAGRVPVIVGVSHAGTDNLVRLAKSVMDDGASGVMIAPTAGLKTEVQIRDYFAGIFKRLGSGIPVCFQDYPLGTGVNISVGSFVQLVDDHPSLVMFKHEDWPGLKKLTQVRHACDGQTRRRISILCGNGGLYLPQELRRGADGAMTGFGYPEMLVEVCKRF